MGLPVTVYRWDDVGAPQLGATPTPSEIIAVLKACLVDGYGSQSGLGWTVAFEDVATSKIAFRNSTADGSGGFVQYWSTNASNNAGTLLYIRAASAMSALDNFTNPSVRFMHHNSPYNSQWVIIGTSIGFYAIPKYDSYDLNYLTSSQYEVTYFVGDLDSNYPNDVSRFTICSANTGSDMSGVNYSHSLTYSTNTACGFMYGVDGNSKSNPMLIDYGGSNVTIQNSHYTLEEQGINPVLIPVTIRVNSTAQTDIDGLPCGISGKNPWFRGIVPGLFSIGFSGYGNESWPTIKTWNGQDYMLLRGYYTATWVNITEWY
jgi:hypothetical protein